MPFTDTLRRLAPSRGKPKRRSPLRGLAPRRQRGGTRGGWSLRRR
ncbi:hypothetical protein [Conexibacter arvalis]|uniref:Uncharacterized protein n=1 Tax=Conexibacter arvalis TaxID=912552 RepID=A0A840I8T3_9ACTN|nr:hypothetical protein [Conexibacter arvalis]MBB4660554.1 hypothetical protein [Conexibacter arvalis]